MTEPLITPAAITRSMIDIAWHPGFRIIPSRFPSVNLFDRVASHADFDALYMLEAMTNDRMRDEVGTLELVPPAQRIFGPGSGPIMAAFTHLNPQGSRFSDGMYGVFYAAKQQQTAVAETQYHSGNFLRATNQAPIRLEMRVYHVEIAGQFDDVQALAASDPVLDPLAYDAGQALARRLRTQGANGIHYRSVRDPAGLCIAAFKTGVLSNCRHASHMLYQWDGNAISAVYEQYENRTATK
jgi:hypothetical protein